MCLVNANVVRWKGEGIGMGTVTGTGDRNGGGGDRNRGEKREVIVGGNANNLT